MWFSLLQGSLQQVAEQSAAFRLHKDESSKLAGLVVPVIRVTGTDCMTSK